MDAATPKTDPTWLELKRRFEAFRSEPDMDAEWTFGGSDGPGHSWRLCRDDKPLRKPELWKLFNEAGERLEEYDGAQELTPKRLLGEKDPVVRWLSALRYLNLNVRVLATAEWRVERGLIWDVVGASSYLCQALASRYPRARVKKRAMHSEGSEQRHFQSSA